VVANTAKAQAALKIVEAQQRVQVRVWCVVVCVRAKHEPPRTPSSNEKEGKEKQGHLRPKP
jgi:hypothetical protein